MSVGVTMILNSSLSAQLISHTKNVERAVTLSQQDMVSKKEQQGTKLQELSHKLASVQQVSDTKLKVQYL